MRHTDRGKSLYVMLPKQQVEQHLADWEGGNHFHTEYNSGRISAQELLPTPVYCWQMFANPEGGMGVRREEKEKKLERRIQLHGA